MISLYIDPMSGIALFNVLLALIMSFWRRILNLFKKNNNNDYLKSDISIFSEGNQYYLTFQPIIEYCLSSKTKIDYYTLDINDKFLRINSPFINPKFLGFGKMGYYNFSKINNKILLSTTPNIGNKSSPLEKPKNVINLIHIFHSISEIGIYKRHSLDHYDGVFLIGKFQEKMIRESEVKRSIKKKTLFLTGAPYFDSLFNQVDLKNQTVNDSVLIASSWGNKGLLNNFKLDWLKILDQEMNRKIIIRPHPQSFKSDTIMIKRLEIIEKLCDNIYIDREISPLKSMEESCVLISDTSSIRYDFAFLFNRPVVTIDIPNDNLSEYEMFEFPSNWDNKSREIIGSVVSSINELNYVFLNNLIESKTTKININELRKETVQNMGNSSEIIVKKLQKNY